jgi:hypothetical protein
VWSDNSHKLGAIQSSMVDVGSCRLVGMASRSILISLIGSYMQVRRSRCSVFCSLHAVNPVVSHRYMLQYCHMRHPSFFYSDRGADAGVPPLSSASYAIRIKGIKAQTRPTHGLWLLSSCAVRRKVKEFITGICHNLGHKFHENASSPES